MPGQIHMVIGSKNNTLQDMVRDMKKHTSATLKTLIIIKENPQEKCIYQICKPTIFC